MSAAAGAEQACPTSAAYPGAVADWEDVRRCALRLPEVTEGSGEHNQWRVKGKLFVWERPLRKGDVAALGDSAPTGPILGVMVADVDEKEAILAEEPDVFFTTPHFNGYPAVLARLERMPVEMLEAVAVDAFLARAPKRLVKEYLAGR
jgi:hypothetical protein